MNTLRYLLAIIVALCLFSVAQAQERSVRVTGEAAAATGQPAISARQLAIDDALRQAVEQGVGVFLTSETLTRNFELVSDQIIKKSSGFARLSTIHNENATASGRYTVDATVIVSSQRILTKLRDLINGIGDPRIGVFITETLDSKLLSATSASTAMSKALVNYGFRVIDQKTLEEQLGREKLIQAQNNPAALLTLTNRINLDYIVTGTARAIRVANDASVAQAGVISTQVILELRMIEKTSGQVVWTDEVNTADFDFSIEVAVSKTMRKTVAEFTSPDSDLMDKLGTLVSNPSDVSVVYTLRLSGFKSFSAFNSFIQKLSASSNIKNVQPRDFDVAGTLVEVKYNGKVDTLAVLLEKLGLQVTGITGREIRAKAK